MTAVTPPARTTAEPVVTVPDFGALSVAGFTSLGAGAIHAAAIGVHSEHRQAVIAFTVVAALQLGFGALALFRSSRVLALAGAAVNLAALGGWVLAKTAGIDFIDGMELKERLQWADGLAAGLAAVAVLAVVGGLLAGRPIHHRLGKGPLSGLGTGVAAISLLGMVLAGSHNHVGHGDEHTAGGAADGRGTEAAAGHGHEKAASHAAGKGDAAAKGDAQPAAAVPPKTYDPTKPIDLGGVPGVTPEQQARAENLIAITLIRLPQFADSAVAEKAGYHSIGDGGTGHEHLINWDYINDDKILNPDFPEALVYDTTGGGRKLVSAMFILREGATLDDVPDVGGKLTQWHVHDDLCFSKDPEAPKVAGLRKIGGDCPPNLQKFTPVPMIHVWITRHPCGPFAALEGVGAGQVKPGEEHLCDHAHGG